MRDRGLTILILGNGFDLAHGLPTRYSDFLEFCQRVELIWSYGVISNSKMPINDFAGEHIIDWETAITIKTSVLGAYSDRKVIVTPDGDYEVTSSNLELSEIHDLLHDNMWYDYFIKLYTEECMKGENWIDFESEIRFIIQEVDRNSLSLTDSWADVVQRVKNPQDNKKFELFENIFFPPEYVEKCDPKRLPTVKKFREKAYEDLERLTRALEIYLAAFVEKISIFEGIPEIAILNPDYVINFNYTNTYQRVYRKGPVYHIHGKADLKRPIEKNNMVLGIDEYWVGGERDERTNFTIFKKFAQRIQKRTGNESYKYLKEIQDVFVAKGKEWPDNVDTSEVHPDGVSNVYVFGHSLDVTDKDVLSSFIGSDATSVAVCCKDRGTEGELIANTIKLIGEEKLLDKANHVPVKLRYVIQKSS